MKRGLKRLLALTLSVIMVCSLLTDLLPAALAAGSTFAAPPAGAGKQLDFADPDNGRPNLNVDFLGDNRSYAPDSIATPNALKVPGSADQSAVTNPSLASNKWKGYQPGDPVSTANNDVIFWVGVGIDRLNVFELFRNAKGVYSFELGFYYDSKYIEPYIAPGKTYQQTIADANLGVTSGYPNTTQWDNNYEILHAEPDVTPKQREPVTEEVLRQPTVDDMMTSPTWKMTYLSMERKTTGTNRFAGDWDGVLRTKADGTPDPAANKPTQYLMILPFRYKQYEPVTPQPLCLRLARNATHFSLGAGSDGAAGYGAWERVTTRNPGHDLKLLTRFTGDLNIFTGGKVLEDPYKASLKIIRGGGTNNKGQLTVTDDPTPDPNKAYADQDGQVLSGLYGGTGLSIHTKKQAGYKVVVTVTDAGGNAVHFDTLKPEEDFRFVMPEGNVTVTITFQLVDAQEFRVYLAEIPFVAEATGNETKIETDKAAFQTGTLATVTHPADGHEDGPSGLSTKSQAVTVTVSTHADYEALVEVFQFNKLETDADKNMTGHTIVTPNLGITQTAAGVVTMPHGGTISFNMPETDVDVRVTYRKAQTHDVKLEVYHASGAPVLPSNEAQLRYSAYSAENLPSSAYSGVVYHKESPLNHSEVASTTEKLPLVDQSSAGLSGSLGGDTGVETLLWSAATKGEKTIMTRLFANSGNPTALAAELLPRDIAGVAVSATPGQELMGLRKNEQGEGYNGSELPALAAILCEIATRIKADTASGGLAETYIKKVTDGKTPPTILYQYFDLTPAQVQAYLLDCLTAVSDDRANLTAYRSVAQTYALAQAVYDETRATVPQVTAPKAPVAPTAVSVTGGVRTHQPSSDYLTTYIAAYRTYIAAYRAYIDAQKGGAAPGPCTQPLPADPAALRSVDLKSPADALTAVDAYAWAAAAQTATAGISTRGGRKVAVVLRADSAYEVDKVEVLDDLGAPLAVPPAVTQSADYINVYEFVMPDENCTARVTYRLRDTRKLVYQVVGAGGQAGNVAELVAFGPKTVAPLSTEPLRHAVTANTTIDPVYTGSTVTVTVKHAKGYKVKGAVLNSGTNTAITTDPAGISNMASGTVFTFKIPKATTGDGDVHVTITYEPEAAEQNDAHINGVTYPGDPAGVNVATWTDTNTNLKAAVTEGTDLTGKIIVEAGYYIHSVSATGASGSYPFTISGNGYQNGYGTTTPTTPPVIVPVTFHAVMPGEEFFVEVTFRKGLPPVAPEQTIALAVVDDSNPAAQIPVGTAADNHASLTVTPAAPGTPVTLGPVGYTKSALAALGGAHAGDRVVVDFAAEVVNKVSPAVGIDPDKSYYVSAVTLSPSGLGVALEWRSPTQVAFTMPGGDVGVTVHFAKGLARTYHLTLDKNETGGTPPTDPVATNFPTNIKSATILAVDSAGYPIPQTDTLPQTYPKTGFGGGIGVAAPGETVTVTARVAPGWYLHSATARDGSGIPTTLSGVGGGEANGYNNGNGGTTAVTFIMPAAEAQLMLNYRKGPPPPVTDPAEYAMTLVVTDPENVGNGAPPQVFADNHAQAFLTGGTADQTAVLGKGTSAAPGQKLQDLRYAKAGDTVTVHYTAALGYGMQVIVVTPQGLRIVPTYLGGGKAQFTMPAESVMVEVRFAKGAAPTHNMNLILRGPGNTVMDLKVGAGTFAAPSSGSLTDYPAHAVYSLSAAPGDLLHLDLLARDGYYIKKITVNSENDTTGTTLSGSFGSQTGTVIMPGYTQNTVNVFYEKAWPDGVKYPLTLAVLDPALQADNHAGFASIAGTALVPPDSDTVKGNERKTLYDAAYDADRVVVAVSAAAGYYYDRSSVTVVDTLGSPVPWDYAPGGIAFTMPPFGVTATVRFLAGAPAAAQKATLHIAGNSGSDAVTLASGALTSVTTDGGVLTPLRAGDGLTLTATPASGHIVSAAYAVDSVTGAQLLLPISQVTTGGAATFAMQEHDAEVYVTFRATAPPADHSAATLVVSGDLGTPAFNKANNAGLAQMTGLYYTGPLQNIPNVPTPTGEVLAGQSGVLFGPKDTNLTVTMTPNAGYHLSSLAALDGSGNAVPYQWVSGSYVPSATPGQPDVWTPNPLLQITLKQPSSGVTVYVSYAKETDPGKTYTAQVVKNDDLYPTAPTTPPSQNSALLRLAGDLVPGKTLVTPKAGDRVTLDIVVHPGFKVEYIKVIPQKYGIAPALSLAYTKGQTTQFIMPADNVVVYVKFVPDGLTRQKIQLDVTGTPGVNDNLAKIATDFSGSKGPIHTDSVPVVVMAAAGEWATVDYRWGTASSLNRVTVEDVNGTPVPFTQVNPYQITFPMIGADVNVVVDFKLGADNPTLHDVTLHVVDLDAGLPDPTLAQAYASMTYGGTIPPSAGALSLLGVGDNGRKVAAADAPGNTATIQVPAGVDIDMEVFSDKTQGYYIQAAYVLYENGGQMMNLSLPPDTPGPGFSGQKNCKFQAHPGTNDVYVYITKQVPATTDFAAVLMLDGPAADQNSKAAIYTGDPNIVGANKATVNVNGPHGYITAKPTDVVTVAVVPAPGYTVESVLLTPLGIPIVPNIIGNTYVFTMPAKNVAVRVQLKASTEKDYTLRLHYSQIGTALGSNRADLWYTPQGAAAVKITANLTTPDTEMTLKENTPLTLAATLDSPYVVLAGYALQGGKLVSFETEAGFLAALEGLAEGASVSDNTLSDGKVKFKMPAGDTDVYLVTTDAPPTKPNWHTSILTLTDENGTLLNSGKNEGTATNSGVAVPPYLQTGTAKSTGTADHVRLTVWANDTITDVATKTGVGYEFQSPATITHAVAVGNPLTETIGAAKPTFVYTVGDYNSAVAMHFRSATATKNPLTVEIIDLDNPGKVGTQQEKNTVQVTPLGMTELKLTSVSVAGAYQTIRDVPKDAAVSVVVTPHSGYHPVATKTDGTVLTLTKQGNGTYLGTMTMPDTAAKITVKFYKPYNAQLELRDTSRDPTSTASLTEDAFGQTANVDGVVQRTNQIEHLPNTTGLVGKLTDLRPGSRLVGVLYTENGATRTMSPTAVAGKPDEYRHTIARQDVKLTFVVEDAPLTPADNRYIASVNTVSAPVSVSGYLPPTIATGGTGAITGPIWTTAKTGETITVHVTVPTGYTAALVADNGVTLSVIKMSATGDATFTMPAANTNVTVTYQKSGGFTATLVMQLPTAAGTASLTEGSTTVTNSGTISNLALGATVSYAASSQTEYIDKIILTEHTTGKVTILPGIASNGFSAAGSFSMPADDVTVTVCFFNGITPPPGGGEGEPDATGNLTAFVELAGLVDPAAYPQNVATGIANTTHTTAIGVSPSWMSGYVADIMQVSFTTQPGYYAKVTARRLDGSTVAVPVIQQGTTGACTASATMPDGDIIFTITYAATLPEATKLPLALTLVGHEEQASNGGAAGPDGNFAAGLSLSGSTTGKWVDPANHKSNITDKTAAGIAAEGELLRLDSSRDPGYTIVKATLTVDGTVIELPLSRYENTATVQIYMPSPPTDPTKPAELTVYFARIYTATLNIVGATRNDSTAMTDDRPGTVPITVSGGKLVGLTGGEQIETSAKPDSADGTTAPPTPANRLVGILYSTPQTGAHNIPKNADSPAVPNRYDFKMPQEDALVTAIYEPEPADPKDRSYLAKLAIDPTSEGYGVGKNAMSIVNTSDPLAPSGPFWTAAKAKNKVDVIVGLEPGYQAEITSAKRDQDSTDIYVNRKVFVADGKHSTFLMPADSDATITVKYTKGYSATLALTDTAASGPSNIATMTDGRTAGQDTITATSNGGSPTATITYDSALNIAVNDGIRTIPALPAAVDIATKLTLQNTNVQRKVVKHTAFTGTSPVPYFAAPDDLYRFPMPGEDTLVSVLLQNFNDPYRQLAKVQLKGESDIVGNASSSIAVTKTSGSGYSPTTGTIWTTTKGDDTITVNLTVAKDYIAEVKVVRDDSVAANPNDPTRWVYLTSMDYDFKVNGTPFGDTAATKTDLAVFGYQSNAGSTAEISENQTLTFTMPKKTGITGDAITDVTVLITYVYAAKIPAPYDPLHSVKYNTPDYVDKAPLKDGWLYAENRGDYAVVTVPTLHDGAGATETLYNADRYQPADATTAVTYRFYWVDPAVTPPPAEPTYVELVVGTDIFLEPYDKRTLQKPTDPYNYDTYYTKPAAAPNPAVPYIGAKFKLTLPAETTTESPQLKALRKILNNDGTRTTGAPAKDDPQLFIQATNQRGEVSEYTQVVVKKTYAVSGMVYSYAPTHNMDVSLYRLMTQAQLDAAEKAKNPAYINGATVVDSTNPQHYCPAPAAENVTTEPTGDGLWRQTFYVRSSELLGDPTAPSFKEPGDAGYVPLTYKMVIEKPAHLTYTRVAMTLNANYTDGTPNYKADTRAFTIQGAIWLLAGDVEGDGSVKSQDYYTMLSHLYGGSPWSTVRDPGDPEWWCSVYNPNSLAHRCDMDGDGRMTANDRNIVFLPQFFNRDPSDYNDANGVMPNGFEVTLMPLSLEGELLGGELLPEEPADPVLPIDPAPPIDPPAEQDPVMPPETAGDLPAEQPPLLLPEEASESPQKRPLDKEPAADPKAQKKESSTKLPIPGL